MRVIIISFIGLLLISCTSSVNVINSEKKTVIPGVSSAKKYHQYSVEYHLKDQGLTLDKSYFHFEDKNYPFQGEVHINEDKNTGEKFYLLKTSTLNKDYPSFSGDEKIILEFKKGSAIKKVTITDFIKTEERRR